MERIFLLRNLVCGGCASAIEEKLRSLPGVSEVNYTLGTQQLRITAAEDNGDVLRQTIQDVCDSVEDGVVVEPFVRAPKRQAAQDHHDHEHNSSVPAIIFGALVLIITLFTDLVPEQFVTALQLAAYIFLGWKIILTAIKNIARGNFFDENLLMSVATIGALLIGEIAEAVGVMLFFQIGTYFEERATESSRTAIMEAVDLRPEEVRLVNPDESITLAPPEDVQIGAWIEVRPGDRIPLDGVIVKGATRIDTAPVTGEPVPVSAKEGDAVVSGCINESSPIIIETTHVLEDSMVMRILDAVESAAASKPKIDRFITRFSRVYTPMVLAIALFTAVVPPLFTGEWQHWIYTALTFLVISCPCALVLSVPLAFFSGIGASSKIGALVKGGRSLEAMSRVKAIAFDKTGTITTGTFTVQSIVPAGISENEVLQWAGSVEGSSTHPIAVSIVSAMNDHGVSPKFVENLEEISGHGMVGMVEGHRVAVGNRRLMDREGIAGYPAEAAIYGSEVLVAVDGRYVGAIVIADALKEDTVAGLAAIHGQGYTTALLTGDVESSARHMGREAGVKEVFGGLLPQDKLTVLKDIRARHQAVMFVGDGINDAPVLSGADVGGAMGSGADAAIEAADVVYMRPSVDAVAKSLVIAKSTLSIAWQNIVVAIAIKVLVMILGFLGYANMWLAVFADTGVSILCIINSIRLFYKRV